MISKSIERSASKISKRQKLIIGGTKLLSERGLDAVNTNSLAQAAGVGVGTFYVHFEDKHDFYRAAVAEALARLGQQLQQAQQRVAERPLLDQVRAGVAAFVEFAENEPTAFRLACERRGPRSRKTPPGLSPKPIEARLDALARAGQLEPAIDCRLAACAYIAAQSQAVLTWLERTDSTDRASLIETLVRLHPAIACGH